MSVEATRAAAFSPGHVTGLFEIHDEHPDPERRGSRGAGFSLAEGAVSVVSIEPADALQIDVTLNGEASDAPTTREAVTTLLREAVKLGKVPLNKDAPKGSRARIRVEAHTTLQLPVSQGFGMSAAGALSSALALAKALRMGRTDAVRAAHVAEVANRTGLGDVVGAALGGFEVRVKPGLPPWGHVQNFVGYGDAVLCVIGGKLETKSVLSDPAKRKGVNDAGGRALAALLQSPSLQAFLEQSQRFARESGLATPELERAMHAAKPHGHASMSMLGNSLFAFGNVPRLVDALAPFGETRVVPVSDTGARSVDVGSVAAR